MTLEELHCWQLNEYNIALFMTGRGKSYVRNINIFEFCIQIRKCMGVF